jgi:hypothetical protein
MSSAHHQQQQTVTGCFRLCGVGCGWLWLTQLILKEVLNQLEKAGATLEGGNQVARAVQAALEVGSLTSLRLVLVLPLLVSW